MKNAAQFFCLAKYFCVLGFFALNSFDIGGAAVNFLEQRKQDRAGLNFYLILDLSLNVNRKPNFWEGLKNNA